MMKRLAFAVLLPTLGLTLSAAQILPGPEKPAGPEWKYARSDDPIAGTSTDTFALKGVWVGAIPSFPYAKALPSLIVGCRQNAWSYTVIADGEPGASLQTGIWDVEYRIDDVQGKFTPQFPVAAARSFVFLQRQDSQKILGAHKALVRFRLFGNTTLVAQFEIPVLTAELKSKCGAE